MAGAPSQSAVLSGLGRQYGPRKRDFQVTSGGGDAFPLGEDMKGLLIAAAAGLSVRIEGRTDFWTPRVTE